MEEPVEQAHVGVAREGIVAEKAGAVHVRGPSRRVVPVLLYITDAAPPHAPGHQPVATGAPKSTPAVFDDLVLRRRKRGLVVSEDQVVCNIHCVGHRGKNGLVFKSDIDLDSILNPTFSIRPRDGLRHRTSIIEGPGEALTQ